MRHIPRKARTRRSPKKDKGKALRYAVYTLTIFLFIVIAVALLLYGKASTVLQPNLEAYSSIALSFFLTCFVLSWLLHQKKSPKQIISQLNLSKSKLTVKMVLIGVAVFFTIALFSLALAAFSSVTNVQLPTNVQQVLSGTPVYFLVFTFLIAPINEEIFFRGFLSPRLGIILSSIVFAFAHLSYLSVAEFAAALFFGLVAAYVFKKTKSLYPSIIAHMLVNLITITSIISLGMFIHL